RQHDVPLFDAVASVHQLGGVQLQQPAIQSELPRGISLFGDRKDLQTQDHHGRRGLHDDGETVRGSENPQTVLYLFVIDAQADQVAFEVVSRRHGSLPLEGGALSYGKVPSDVSPGPTYGSPAPLRR